MLGQQQDRATLRAQAATNQANTVNDRTDRLNEAKAKTFMTLTPAGTRTSLARVGELTKIGVPPEAFDSYQPANTGADALPGVAPLPPQDESKRFMGTQADATAEANRQARADAQAASIAAAKERSDEGNKTRVMLSSVAQANKPQKMSVQSVTLPDGTPGMVRLNTETGDVTPVDLGAGVKAGKPNATLGNRLESAKAVTQTGNDIIQKLADPAFAETVGPVLGRFSSLRDFLGAPPVEYANLAGEIESYALANMGVHGMRSTEGAKLISHLLDQKHTPASLIATIQGLNGFSNRLMANNGVGGSQASTPASAPQMTPEQRAADFLKRRSGNGR
jgi:hypothetical protein